MVQPDGRGPQAFRRRGLQVCAPVDPDSFESWAGAGAGVTRNLRFHVISILVKIKGESTGPGPRLRLVVRGRAERIAIDGEQCSLTT